MWFLMTVMNVRAWNSLDLELVGIPHRIVVSEKNINTENPSETLYEYVDRRDGEKQLISLADSKPSWV